MPSGAGYNAVVVERRPYFIFFDGNCRICTRSKQAIERIAPSSADLRFVDIQQPSTLSRFPMVDPAAAQGQMFVLDPRGDLRGGYDGIVSLLPAMPVLRWLAPVLGLGPVRTLGRRVYAWVARNRYRLGGSVSCASDACRV